MAVGWEREGIKALTQKLFVNTSDFLQDIVHYVDRLMCLYVCADTVQKVSDCIDTPVLYDGPVVINFDGIRQVARQSTVMSANRVRKLRS
jgi:hypothetical protein